MAPPFLSVVHARGHLPPPLWFARHHPTPRPRLHNRATAPVCSGREAGLTAGSCHHCPRGSQDEAVLGPYCLGPPAPSGRGSRCPCARGRLLLASTSRVLLPPHGVLCVRDPLTSPLPVATAPFRDVTADVPEAGLVKCLLLAWGRVSRPVNPGPPPHPCMCTHDSPASPPGDLALSLGDPARLMAGEREASSRASRPQLPLPGPVCQASSQVWEACLPAGPGALPCGPALRPLVSLIGGPQNAGTAPPGPVRGLSPAGGVAEALLWGPPEPVSQAVAEGAGPGDSHIQWETGEAT